MSQVVDNDGDGQMDELIFQGDFGAGESKRFSIEARAPQPTPAKRRVYACTPIRATTSRGRATASRFASTAKGCGKSIRCNSSGLDIWVKRTREPIVDKWYAKGHDDYHRDTGEGADFFDVGETLGAGGTGDLAQ